MPKIDDILKEKARRLNIAPEELFERIKIFQRSVYDDMLEMLMRLETDSTGAIIRSRKNLRIADDIREALQKVFNSKSWKKVALDFVANFDKQKKVTDKYFKEAFDGFKDSKINDAILEASKESAIRQLAGSTPTTGFLESIQTDIDKAVTTGASWKETVRNLRITTTGIESDVLDRDGKLLRYAKQIASDSIAIADRSYTYAISESLEAQWFIYFGDEIPTTREFCDQRAGNYYHKKEIEAWASLDWAGKMKESTNEQTIFVNCGGWNCKHQCLPVTVDQVPKDVLLRNIDNGNYEPTEFDKSELELEEA